MAEGERLICASGELLDAGRGVRFETAYFGETVPAFVVRHRGSVRGFLNRCSHVAMELDWQEGMFFDADGTDLICSTHGATYSARDGSCLGGPCNGKPLVALRIEERDGGVYFKGFDDGG